MTRQEAQDECERLAAESPDVKRYLSLRGFIAGSRCSAKKAMLLAKYNQARHEEKMKKPWQPRKRGTA